MTATLAAEPLLKSLPAHGEPMPIAEPFTGDLLAVVPQMTAADIDDAFDRARHAQPAWAAVPVARRATIAGKLLDRMHANREALLDTLQREGGKARIDGLVELGEALLGGRHHVNTAERVLSEAKHPGVIPALSSTRVVRQPRGVVVVIVPWNFPIALGVVDAIPAVLAGNSVILKADTQTAMSTLLFRRMAIEAGVPENVFQVVAGRASEIGDALLDQADYIAFTGSTATGRAIGRRAGERLIGCSLELGGKNPMIVLPDADLRRAANAIPRASFANAGQLCMTTERLYVHESVIKQFADLVVDGVKRIRLGATYDYESDMGSITTAANFTRLNQYIEQAVESGARVLIGGRVRPEVGPRFFEPTVLTDVAENARLHREEVFGPVVSLASFRSVDEAIDLANRTEYGLSASVWTRDTAHGREIGRRIRAGCVNVNDGYAAAFGAHTAPAGGMKASGVGRRHGTGGLLRYTESQTIATQRFVSLDSRFKLPRNVHGRLFGYALGPLQRLR